MTVLDIRSTTAYTKYRMKRQSYHTFWYGFNITAGLLIPSFLFIVPFLHAFEGFAQTVDMFLSQQSDLTADGTTAITVGIENTHNTALNAAEFELIYDPRVLEVKKIVPHTTLCEDRFMITNTIDNVLGTALFQCGTITAFSGATGTIATVYVTPLVSGTSSIAFGTTTHLLVHDGLGTDATNEKINLIFTAL